MGNMVIVDEDYLDDTGLAIQEKLGTTDKFNPSEFGDSIRSIPSGGSSLKLLGQMDTRVYCNTSGQIATNSSNPGPYSTYVYELPSTATVAVNILGIKKQVSNRCRMVMTTANPLLATVPTSGVVASGTYRGTSDNISELYFGFYASGTSSENMKYLTVNLAAGSSDVPPADISGLVY